MSTTENTNYKLLGWKRNGQPIPTPEGIHVEDYFSAEGQYLGPDQDGVEPVLDSRG